MEEKPKLRHIEALPAEMKGERVICLRDTSGMSNQVVAVAPPAFFLVALCDGTNTIRDIQVEYMRRFGELIHSDNIRALIEQLDNALLLEGEKFEAHRRNILREFREAPVRRPTHAGTAYPKGREALRKRLDGFFTHPEGPGPVDRLAAGSGVVAIAAPHIDLKRGGPCYAHAYKALVERCAARTFVILGTLHAQAEGVFVVTNKDFDTPLGLVRCDHDFAHELMRRAGLDRTDDELAHRSEHSVEFQAVFLRHFFGASRPARIVPVLCGPILQAVGETANPLEVPEVGNFITALHEMLRERAKEVAVIASVDLSHVGRRFSDSVNLNAELLARVESEDRALLRHAENLDAASFFEHNRRNQDRTHVCGFPALYALLSAVEARRGRLLRYDQAPEEQTQSVVSFAAMAFEE